MKKYIALTLLFTCLCILVSCGGGGGGGATVDDTSFTIGYNANGAESGSVPSVQSGNGKTALAVSANTGSLAKSGYLFDGWNTQPDGYGTDYAPGAEYKGKNITLYAKWARLFNYNVNQLSPAQALNGVQRAPGNPTATITGLTSKGMTLSDITIPRAIDGYTVAAIGDNAFQGCTNVANMLIPDTVTDIGDNAFNGCSNLSGVTMQGTIPPTLGTDAFAGCVLLAVSVPQSAASAYNSSPTWSTVAILAPGTFSIIYNGNGSDGGIVPARQVGMVGLNTNIYGNSGNLTRAGCYFTAWNTKSDGTGNYYNDGSYYDGPDDMTLYAIWGHPDYYVNFDSQGADTPASPSSIIVVQPANTIGSLPSTPPKKDGYYFAGWNTQSNGEGEPFVVGSQVISSMTVYAKWNANSYTITYNGNNASSGSVPESQTALYNQSVILCSNTNNLTRPDCYFGGWNTKEDGSGTDYTEGASYTITGDVTLFARWVTYSSIANSRVGAAVGDVVLSNKATIKPADYMLASSAIKVAGLEPVGVVAYKGGTEIATGNGDLGTLTAGTNGKIYMIGLTCGGGKWAGRLSTGYETNFSTSNVNGYGNWSVIHETDSSGTNDPNNPAKNYPAFKYALSYKTKKYTSGWYLPSIAELKLIYFNNTTIDTGIRAASGYPLCNYERTVWSSSQVSDNSSCVWSVVTTYGGTVVKGYKDKEDFEVRPVRALDD